MAEVHPQEMIVQGDQVLDTQEAFVDMPGKVEHVKRGGSHSPDDSLVQTNDDRELQQGWQAGRHRVVPDFLVKLHLLLGQFFLIALVFLLDIQVSFVFLQLSHGCRAFDLRCVQRVGDQTDQQGKQNDRNTKVAHQLVDQEQHINKRSNYNRIPHNIFLFLLGRCVGPHLVAITVKTNQKLVAFHYRYQYPVFHCHQVAVQLSGYCPCPDFGTVS